MKKLTIMIIICWFYHIMKLPLGISGTFQYDHGKTYDAHSRSVQLLLDSVCSLASILYDVLLTQLLLVFIIANSLCVKDKEEMEKN